MSQGNLAARFSPINKLPRSLPLSSTNLWRRGPGRGGSFFSGGRVDGERFLPKKFLFIHVTSNERAHCALPFPARTEPSVSLANGLVEAPTVIHREEHLEPVIGGNRIGGDRLPIAQIIGCQRGKTLTVGPPKDQVKHSIRDVGHAQTVGRIRPVFKSANIRRGTERTRVAPLISRRKARRIAMINRNAARQKRNRGSRPAVITKRPQLRINAVETGGIGQKPRRIRIKIVTSVNNRPKSIGLARSAGKDRIQKGDLSRFDRDSVSLKLTRQTICSIWWIRRHPLGRGQTTRPFISCHGRIADESGIGQVSKTTSNADGPPCGASAVATVAATAIGTTKTRCAIVAKSCPKRVAHERAVHNAQYPSTNKSTTTSSLPTATTIAFCGSVIIYCASASVPPKSHIIKKCRPTKQDVARHREQTGAACVAARTTRLTRPRSQRSLTTGISARTCRGGI